MSLALMLRTVAVMDSTDTEQRRLRALFAPTQVHAKTVIWVLGTALVFLAVIWGLMRAEMALGLTAVSLALAIALDHPVQWLVRHRWPRSLAIAVVLLAVLGANVGIAFILVPPFVSQIVNFANELPENAKNIQSSELYRRLNERFDLSALLSSWQERLPHFAAQLANNALKLLGSLAFLIGAIVTLFFIAMFMLIYGPDLVQRILREARRTQRPRYERVLGNIYRSLGGYINGLVGICFLNAFCTTIFLAIVGVPYFLPLGLLSGLSSLVPIVGATFAGVVITVIVFLTKGIWPAVASAIFFVLYQQVENNLVGPMVYRRTVAINPLLSLIVVLFFGEVVGLVGALLAIPVLATVQIVLGEFLRVRQQWFQQEKPDEAPEGVTEAAKAAERPRAPPPPPEARH